MPNTYIDTFDYVRAPNGLEYQSLLGNAARFTSTQPAASTSLTVPATGANSVTVALGYFDRVVILDGSSTEVVQVGPAGATVGATSIPLIAGTQFSHGAGVAWCSDGIYGSLADAIIDASEWLEHLCYQSLLQTTYINELLSMPTMRAAIDTDGQLTFRPRHWPVSSVTAIAIAWTPTLVVTYDPAQTFIDGNGRMCSVPNLIMLPNQQIQNSNLLTTPSRSRKGQVKITYQAGYAYSALPGDLKEAAILLTSDILAKRQNPVGATEIDSGGIRNVAVLRGDNAGESLLFKRAKRILDTSYAIQMF